MARTKKADNTTNIVPVRLRNHEYATKYINDDWGTIAFKIPRNEIQQKFEDAELRFNCIYFLIGLDGVTRKVYTGQAKKRNNGESVLARLREHDKSATDWYCDIWTTAIVLTNKNDTWSLDDLNALEHAFYNEIPLEHSLNGNNPNSGGADYSTYTDKIKQVKDYIIALGYKIFTADESAEDSENIQIMPEINDNAPVEDLQNGLARIPEIVTPHKVVKAMCDMLPPEVWNDQTVFLDPACKGGEYLREIYDRLMDCELLQAKYPNETARSNHILIHQIYGIALSEISKERTKNNLNEFDLNIRVISNYIRKLKGISLGSRPDGTSKTMQDILNEEFNKDMKIDVVIGNPPYQENGNGAQKTPLYHRFVEMGLQISEYCTWIIPSRWFSSGIGLNEFRHMMINNPRLSVIKQYNKSTDLFKGVDIAGGVCIIHLDNNENDKIQFIDGRCNNMVQVERKKCRHGKEEILLDRCEAYEIITKINGIGRLSERVKSLNYFGIREEDLNIIDTDYDNIAVVCSYDNVNYISDKCINNKQDINKYKVITGKVNPDRGGVNNSTASNVINKPKILNPMVLCSFSYMIVDIVDTQVEAINVCNYIKCKFTRFLLLITLSSMNISSRNWMFVPLQDFTPNSDIDWSQPISDIDQQLYRKYGLTQEEIDYIEKTIKPME